MTKASDNAFPSVLITEGTEPSAPAAGKQRLYIDSTTHKLKRTDSSGVDVTVEGGLADQGAFTYLDATEASAPSTPASGKVRVYAKADGRIYSKDDAGVEYGPFSSGGGGGSSPLLAADAITLHGTYGDDFPSATLDGKWSLQGFVVGDITLDTSLAYDATVLALSTDTNGDVIHQAAPGGDFTIIQTCHGTTNNGYMEGVCITDSSGNGIGFSPYNDGNAYLWTLASWSYSGTGNVASAAAPYKFGTADYPWVVKLAKVGTGYVGSCSGDGGQHYISTASQTNSTTMTRIGFGRFFSTGAHTWKVGRFNVV